MAGGIAEEVLPIVREAHAVLQKAKAYEKVLAFLKRKNAYPIVFLGASGTGKTALLRSLAGLPPAVGRGERTDSVVRAVNKLKEAYLEVYDTPGEIEHSSKREKLIRELMRKSSIGVVNVVSHGFHEGLATQASAVENRQASAEFLEERRRIELELLKEWLGPLCGNGGSVSWILTVVTKADLWWKPGVDQEVMQYYSGPEYKDAFSVTDDTPHSIKPYSSLNQLFYDAAPMTGYYSDARRSADFASIAAHILTKASEHG